MLSDKSISAEEESFWDRKRVPTFQEIIDAV